MSREIYQVAAILNNYNLVISAGENYGLSRGTKIEIFEEGPEISHPETGESLGRLILVKAVLEIVHVDELYSICQYFIEEEEIKPGISGMFSALGEQRVVRKRLEPLPVDASDLMETTIPLPTQNKVIKIGDKARIPY